MERLPDFIVIGGMKCGSTSLYEYLSHHPEISPCKLKEPSFFSIKWDKGLRWYNGLFEETDKKKFEASTSYSKYPWFPETPERIKSVVPDIKLLYIVRHPIERLRSQIHHNLIVGRLSRKQVDSEDFWHELGDEYINFSKYSMQVQHYLKYFDRDQLFILTLEDLSKEPKKTLTEVADFIGVNPEPFKRRSEIPKYNVSGQRRKMKYNLVHRGLRFLNKQGLIPPVHERLMEDIDRPEFTPGVLEHMWSRLADDMAEFQDFMGRDLGYSAPATVKKAVN